jgi:TolB-like protein/Flp pilus assembly protein TadD
MSLPQGKHLRPLKPTIRETLPEYLEAREAQPSLAVLPFRNLLDERDEEHFSEGIADELLQGLNRIAGLRVLSRTTSFPYAQAALAPAEIGAELQVNAILCGSFRRWEGQVALQAELVDSGAKAVIWTDFYSVQQPELLTVLRVIIARVAAVLGLPVGDPAQAAVDAVAFEDYLRGRHHYFRFNRKGMASAARMFQRALDRDPGFASAWAGLANCAAYSYIYLERTEAQREQAELCSRRALELDPALAEAHASRGMALSAAGQADEAEAAFQKALHLDPACYTAAYFYARHCLASGKPEMAIQFFEWAASLRPEDFQAILLVAQVYHGLGIEDEAAEARRVGPALVEQRLERDPEDARARYFGANALVALGEREKGLAWARMARAIDPKDPMLLYNLGCIHALAGNGEESLECLTMAVAEGLSQKDWLLHDGDLDSIRSKPGFAALVEAMKG